MRCGVAGISSIDDAERRERIVDGVDHGRRRADRAAFADALGLGDGGVAVGFQVMELDRRHLVRGRRQIVGQRGGQDVAGLVVDDFLQQRVADALRDTAMDLAVGDHRIDEPTGIFGDQKSSRSSTSPVSTSTSTIATWQALEKVPAGS